jgi:hypothetical protein
MIDSHLHLAVTEHFAQALTTQSGVIIGDSERKLGVVIHTPFQMRDLDLVVRLKRRFTPNTATVSWFFIFSHQVSPYVKKRPSFLGRPA